MAKTAQTVTVEIPSFQELLDRQSDEKKLAAAKQVTLKIKKEAKISGQIADAHVKALEAKEAFENALISENGDEAQALHNFEKAAKTLEFYQKLYNSLFPNA